MKVKSSTIQDAVNIYNGVYAPLSGFLREKDFYSVLDSNRLVNGEIWSLPFVIDLDKAQADKFLKEKEIKVVDRDNENSYFVLNNIEIFKNNKKEYALKAYGTLDVKHPGVERVMMMGNYLLGGDIVEINFSNSRNEYIMTPEDVKKIINDNNWKTIVAFQTRNVPHRGHEFLQKYALESFDGLLIHPVIGEKKDGDFKDEYILASYDILIKKYFPKNKTLLAGLPITMQYAGPREALMHALIRRNYGCTHFIVGRDHAGVGNYYRPTEAQEIFDNFSKDDLGIEILKYNEVVYDNKNKKHDFVDNVEEDDKIRFSGTKLRNYIKNKEKPPTYILRPEVYDFLVNSVNPLVKNMEKNNNNQKGFVLWFTGLSAAGKSTIADRVFKFLEENNYKSERLDGDVVRENLTKDLGFSKDDRDENIRRIGFVANLLSKNGVAVVASFIAPYQKQRDELKAKVHNFIEVFVNTPLEVCEKRDPKGLYKKARNGEIKGFTGIDDPYEEPINPDIDLKTDELSIDECFQKVIDYLSNNKYI